MNDRYFRCLSWASPGAEAVAEARPTAVPGGVRVVAEAPTSAMGGSRRTWRAGGGGTDGEGEVGELPRRVGHFFREICRRLSVNLGAVLPCPDHCHPHRVACDRLRGSPGRARQTGGDILRVSRRDLVCWTITPVAAINAPASASGPSALSCST